MSFFYLGVQLNQPTLFCLCFAPQSQLEKLQRCAQSKECDLDPQTSLQLLIFSSQTLFLIFANTTAKVTSVFYNKLHLTEVAFMQF